MTAKGKKFGRQVEMAAQSILGGPGDIVRDVVQRKAKKNESVLKISKALPLSLSIGPISYEFWKSGNKITVLKTVLPGFKTAERDEHKVVSNKEAMAVAIQVVAKAFSISEKDVEEIMKKGH